MRTFKGHRVVSQPLGAPSLCPKQSQESVITSDFARVADALQIQIPCFSKSTHEMLTNSGWQIEGL